MSDTPRKILKHAGHQYDLIETPAAIKVTDADRLWNAARDMKAAFDRYERGEHGGREIKKSRPYRNSLIRGTTKCHDAEHGDEAIPARDCSLLRISP